MQKFSVSCFTGVTRFQNAGHLLWRGAKIQREVLNCRVENCPTVLHAVFMKIVVFWNELSP